MSARRPAAASSAEPGVERPRTRSFRGGVVLSLLGYALPPAASLAATPLLARALGVDGRGYLAAATAPVLLLVTIGALGLPQALTYFVASGVARVRSLASRALLLTAIVGAVLTAVLIALADLISGGSVPRTDLVVVAALSIVPTLMIGVLRGIAMGRHQWRAVAWERAVSSIARLAVIIALAVLGELNLFTAVLCSVYVPLLGVLPYVALAVFGRRHEHAPVGDPVGWRRFGGYGLRIWAGSLTGVLLMRVDQALMAPLSTAFELGLYVVAVNVSEVPLIVNAAFRDVTFASESQRVDDGRVVRAAQSSLLLTGAIGLVICGSLPLWLVPLFGAEFAPAAPLVVLMTAAVVVGTPGSIAGSTLSGRGAPQLRSWSLAIACLVNVALVVLLIPVLGAYGAALATLVGNLVSSNLNIVWLTRRADLRFLDFYRISPEVLVGAAREIPRLHTRLRQRGARGRR
ncbi:polysaccharide biosynthesis C-terminal domain-containing protein [Amnibacterium endophyticum]|uniref:Polysaccharide biosynthesis C-terminal domain-containing protein n=1 Tax=Amnibacterium endophyticum TaxID=2109337 RepID=A0ABW4LDB7_9MICO